jgi:uncharacterized protein YbjT (DUF2867 family)
MSERFNIPYFDCLLLGYSGAVGKELLTELIKSDKVNRIVCLGRTEPNIEHHKLVFIQSNFSQLTEQLDAFAGISRVYCCLGTTIKKAGSQDNFRKVDYDMVVNAAVIAHQAGVRHFSLISAMGANSRSSIFYNRVKGETEEALKAIGFPRLSIYRPALLIGPRKESRLGENIAKILSPLLDLFLVGKLKNYQSIKTNTIAKAMLLNSIKTDEGNEVFLSNEIKLLAKGLK